ncbi:MAG TPA: hypothetical protein PLQ76_04235 [bacterium]|nr:hypothetical protein [bacterium]
MGDKKIFSERLHEIVMDLVEGNGRTKTAEDLGMPGNYFSPSKYNYERFSGKHIGHLDSMEEYFGIDLLGGSSSALAREIERAEDEGALSRHDRNAILSIVRAARERGRAVRGNEAVEKIISRKSPKNRK